MNPDIPRNHNWSRVTKWIRGSDNTIEVNRWYAGPVWGNLPHTYHITRYSAVRLSRINLARILGVS